MPQIRDPADIEIMRTLWSEGLSREQIGAHFNISAHAVDYYKRTCDFGPHPTRWTKGEKQELQRRWFAGESSRRIARAMGRTPSVVTMMAHRMDLPRRVGGYRPAHADEARILAALKERPMRAKEIIPLLQTPARFSTTINRLRSSGRVDVRRAEDHAYRWIYSLRSSSAG